MRFPPRLLAPLALLLTALPAAAAGPAVWGESSMVKVRPGMAPHAPAELHLTAARNELVSFQVGLHGGDAGLRGVHASLPSLEGPGRIAGPDVTLYREDFVTTRTPSTPDTEVGRWPDALVPDVDEIAHEQRTAFPFDVPAREARAVWVDVHVPLDAPAGDYQGAVEVTGDGLRQQVPVRLTVVDAVLPSTPSLSTAFGVWAPHVCEAYLGRTDCSRQELEPLLTRFQRMALEHRITLSSAFPLVPGESGFWNEPDWSSFDATWGPFLDGTAPSRLPGARMTSVQYMGEYTPQALADFASHFREHGWLPRAFAYVGDEPPYGTSWDVIRQRSDLVRQAAPDLRVLLTTTLQELRAQHMEDRVDLPVPLINFIDGTEAPYVGDQHAAYTDFLAQPGHAIWLYQSCMSHGCSYGTNAPENKPGAGWPSYMLDRSAAKARALEWLSFLEGATGELYYQTVGMLSTAWEDQYRFNGNGDGTLFYLGTAQRIGGSTAVPVASIRLKLIRQG
ncbi:MAG: glycoside hydrolase domain-containing protein, partial [Archangium sp.]